MAGRMTEELMLLMADHATGKTYWTPPEQWYAAYFESGTEVTGGSIVRAPIDFADAVALTADHIRAGSSNSQIFTNFPTTGTDEVRIVDTPSGAITLTGWIFDDVQSFTSGDDWGFAADKIAIHLQNPA